MRSRKSKRSGNFNMPGPSLWENTSAETFVQLVAALNLEGAKEAYRNWQATINMEPQKTSKEPAAIAAKQALDDWQNLISPWLHTGKQYQSISPEELSHLIVFFKNYNFGKWLQAFASNLLQLLYRLTQDQLMRLLNPPAIQASPTNNEDPQQENNDQQSSLNSLIYSIVENITCHLLAKNATSKTKAQAEDLLKLAAKASPKDGRYFFLLAYCFYQNRKKEDAYQLYANCFLHFPDLAIQFAKNKIPGSYPKDILKLLQLQEQPAKAAALGTIQGIFGLIDFPNTVHFTDPEQQAALDCYLALFKLELATAKGQAASTISACRKTLMLADKQLWEMYLKKVKAREQN